ncbi:MAG: thiol:disulfide interchange protein DsbA/DsbL [Proteobacteria bacterium]|nr:thiol:disulfide interchange protein DsbA/DsbL [Pseudomonadota bacterium]
MSFLRFAHGMALCSLMLLAATPGACALAADPEPVQGLDYEPIDNAQAPQRGTPVQVVEVFGFGCPYCAEFQPDLSKWAKTLPADVRFSYLPAPFGADPEHCWDQFARAFYAAQAMGVEEKSHDAIFKAKFEQNRIPNCDAIAPVYADFGPDPAVFASTMRSFPVSAKLAAAQQQVLRWGVDSTPTLVVDGAYRVLMTRSGGPDGMLRTVDWLIAKQRPLHAAHPEKH